MNTRVVAAFLDERLGVDLVAAFIYGSVAAGRAGPGSDLDCFVLIKKPLGTAQMKLVKAEFGILQSGLGYVSDPDYPIELFTVDACHAVLGSDLLNQVLSEAATTGNVDPQIAEHDHVEVLRALLDHRIVVRDAPALDLLTTLAHDVLNRRPAPGQLRRTLGLDREPPIRL
ncbi:nucleotidyltransferase domain-containing protein [Phytohabitans sp. ZYX-F-186]|uniref:Nucleotidyltransferase domain-containing protein n=1 Tax=Phytohabitans maris TaxID=3071409 RepID=A0ABU0ZQ17_9ACTN|nr:nucleotidyltransferase domain-containing protein [Phytohabitans sp. ZYX-F-186]MDQ7909100.1 nucleotidyltransferase domain-containing protein [Phytohabitans sp. ZYX-F-186]